MKLENLKYAICEGIPAVLATDRDSDIPYAWCHVNGAWQPADAIEVGDSCGLVPQRDFEYLYPKIGLPTELITE